MQESVYYKATDEDGNTVLKHGWKKHKYLYIKNGKYIYPEDVYKTVKNGVRKTAANIDQKVSSMYRKNIYPHTEAGKIDAMNRKANARQKVIAKQHKQLAVKDSRVKSGGSPVDTSAVRRAKAQRMLAAKKTIKAKASVPYKGPTSATSAQNAQKERDLQKRIRAVNAHTVAKKKQQRQMKQIKANVKKQNAPSTKVKKAVKFATKVATRDSAAKMAATRYLVSKASKSPTANAAKAKARSVVSKGEYKLERAGQKLARDVKKTGAYKATRRATSAARKAKTNAQDRALTSAEVRNKANSVKSKAEYKISRAGQKLANDAKPYTSSAKKQFDRASKNAGKAYNSAKKEFNRVSKNANKAYKTAKKRVKKVRRSFNKAKRAGKAYLDYLTK